MGNPRWHRRRSSGGCAMTYAEQFNVPSSLETPAKWLQWAKTALVSKDSGKCAYNLRQFWASIQGMSGADVMRLNAESQACLASYYMSQQYEKTYTLAKLTGNAQLQANMAMIANPATLGIGAITAVTKNKAWNTRYEGLVNWFLDKVDLGTTATLKKEVEELGTKAKAAAERAASMAQEAQGVRSTARGARLAKVTRQQNRTTKAEVEQNRTTAKRATYQESPADAAASTWGDFWSYKILGMPWWVLAGCVVASAAFLVPDAPELTVSAGGGRRR